MALADRVLVGSGAGKIYALRGGQWQQVAQWDKAQWSELPVRAASYGKSALVWMCGNDPGTVPGALEVTAQGQVIQLEVQAAQRSQGGIWQSSYVPALRVSTQFPSGLKLLVAQVRGHGAACLLATHGLVSAGTTLREAMKISIEIESLCQTYLAALAAAHWGG